MKGGADVAGEREMRERARKFWLEESTREHPWEDMAAFAAAERDAERERCCRDVCEYCNPNPNWEPAEFIANDSWRHKVGTLTAPPSMWQPCKASNIRSRVAAKEKKA